jgi:glycosyltransferase involved in cell wall biosynthesis
LSVTVKVSVIVPVYNPGANIDDCIASVLRQSLPADEYEAIFVDDGSTDGTGDRLDALAAEHDNVSVIHIPNSGWPGRPRNLGIEAAVGDYVLFVDNDDYIGDEALERLWNYAEANSSDIVIGKVTGRGRVIPREIFRKNRPDAKLGKDPLLALLTPHKLFRRTFLMETGIRFPEGRRRLEDHVFVMQAYFKATVISVLSDYPCYYWVRREDRSNASYKRFDPVGYFDNLREVLDIVDANTVPGPGRDKLLAHWYRLKLLGRMGGRKLLNMPEDYREEMFAEIRRLAVERFGSGTVAALPMNLRARSRLVRAGRLDLLVALAEIETGMTARLELERAVWNSGALELRVRGGLHYADGTPVAFHRAGEVIRWEPPQALAEAPFEAGDLDVSRALGRSRIRLLVKSVDEGSEFVLPAEATIATAVSGDSASATITAAATLDPQRAAARGPLGAGAWRIRGSVLSCGWDVGGTIEPHAHDTTRTPARVAVAGDPPRVLSLQHTRSGRLTLSVDPTGGALGDLASATPLDVEAATLRASSGGDDVRLSMVQALSSAPRTGTLAVGVTLTPRAGGDAVSGAASLRPSSGRVILEALVPAAQLAPGWWDVGLVSGDHTLGLDAVLEIGPAGAPTLRTARPASSRGGRTAPVLRAVEHAARDVLRRVPPLHKAARRIRAFGRARRDSAKR